MKSNEISIFRKSWVLSECWPNWKKWENEINDKNQKIKMNCILPLKYSIIPKYWSFNDSKYEFMIHCFSSSLISSQRFNSPIEKWKWILFSESYHIILFSHLIISFSTLKLNFIPQQKVNETNEIVSKLCYLSVDLINFLLCLTQNWITQKTGNKDDENDK